MTSWINTPDWPEARERWSAFWSGELLDRPPVLMTVAGPEARPEPPVPPDHERRWCDPDYLIARTEARTSSRIYLGEAVPVGEALMVAWCPVYGGEVRYLPDTIWIEPTVTDWVQAPDWGSDWDDPGWRLLKSIYRRTVSEAGGRYMVGLPPMLPPNDLLSMLRGSENFLLDLLTEQDQVDRALDAMQRNYIRMWNEIDEMRDRSTGYGNWWPIWCPNRVRIVQSDISCMISGELFRRFITPELQALGSDVDHLFYHLDGPDAIRHLDLICDVEKVHAIQWVPGAGNPGHGLVWLELYKRVQELGRKVWVSCSEEELPAIMRELDHRKLLLSLSARDQDDGYRILELVRNLSDN